MGICLFYGAEKEVTHHSYNFSLNRDERGTIEPRAISLSSRNVRFFLRLFKDGAFISRG